MTRHGEPSSRLSQSITSTTLGCLSREITSASRRNRATRSSSRALSDTTTRDAERVERTVSALDHVRASAARSADDSAAMEQVTLRAAREAAEVGAAVREMAAALQTIIRRTAIVTELASETSLLALNASLEAARAVLDHTFEKLGLPRVRAGANPANPASWRILERLGFVRQGLVHTPVEDLYTYVVTREEWRVASAPAVAESE